MRERLKFLPEAAEALAFLFREPAVPAAADLIPKKLDAQRTKAALALGRELLASVGVDSHEAIEAAFSARAESEGFKLGDLLMPLRVAVTGTRVSPPLFESIKALGVHKALPRIDAAMEALS